jgi:hypothetical protein
VVLRVGDWTGLLEQAGGNPRAPVGGVGSRAGEAGWRRGTGGSGQGHYGRCAVRCEQENPERGNPCSTVMQEIIDGTERRPFGALRPFAQTHLMSGTISGTAKRNEHGSSHQPFPAGSAAGGEGLRHLVKLAPIRVGPRQPAEKGAPPSQKAGTVSGRMKQCA